MVVRVSGDLSTMTAPRLRTVLLKCVVEQPAGVVVDLTGAVLRERRALTVLFAVARQASIWPGTPLSVCTRDPEMARQLGVEGSGRLPVFPSAAQALAAEPRRGRPTLSDLLLPVSGAARRARSLAWEACSRWDLPYLADPARVVAGELATNAVVHAETMADLRFTLGRRYLMIAVRDGSSREPVLDRGPLRNAATGRGLLLVDAMAHRWGSMPTEDGKVVWASLAVRTGAGD